MTFDVESAVTALRIALGANLAPGYPIEVVVRRDRWPAYVAPMVAAGAVVQGDTAFYRGVRFRAAPREWPGK